MSTWTLILWLYGTGYSYSPAVDHIDGFTSAASCKAAGDAFVQLEGSDHTWHYAVCVEKRP